MDGWLCPLCQTSNSKIKEQCEVCGKPRNRYETCLNTNGLQPIYPPSFTLANAKFSQTSLEKRNHSVNVSNLVAVEDVTAEDSAMVDLAKSAEGDTSDWQCTVCTLRNRLNFASCRVCESPRSNPTNHTDIPDNQHLPSSSVVTPETQSVGNCLKCSNCNSENAAYFYDEPCRFCGAICSRTLLEKPSVSAQQDNDMQSEEKPSANHSVRSSVDRIQPAFDVINCSTKTFFPSWNCLNCTSVNDASLDTCEDCGMECEFSQKITHSYHEQASTVLSTSQQMQITSTNSPHTVNFPDWKSMERQRHERDSDVIKEVKEMQDHYRHTGEKFVDETFIPDIVASNSPSTSSSDNNYQLLRSNQIMSSTSSPLLGKNPQPSDVIQGQLGTCWFLAALAVLTKLSRLLQQLLITRIVNETGVYAVRLCKFGIWRTIIIDDFLPCDSEGKLVYSKSQNGQPWVSLLEKALAKMHGGYEVIRGGEVLEGFATLTGAPCEKFSFHGKDSDMIWAKLLSSKEAGFLMGASCGGGNMEVNEAEYHEQGLRPRHAYSVLDVRAPRTFDNNVVRLIQLRNPWGRHSWKGAWSDWSRQWKQNLRLGIHLLPNQSHVGIFWMELDDFIKYFDSVFICKVRKDWFDVRRNGEFSNSTTHPLRGFYLAIDQNSHFEFSLIQQVPRTQEGTNSNMLDICLCVYESNREDNGKCSLGRLVTCGGRQVSRHLSCGCDLKPGNYVVVCMAFKHWPSGLVDRIFCSPDTTLPQYVLALHSNKSFTLADPQEIDGLLADAVIELALKKGEKIQVEEGITFYRLGEGWSGYIMIVENFNRYRTLQVDVDFSQSSNVVSTRGSLITKDTIPPLHRQVLAMLSQLNLKEILKVKASWNYKFLLSSAASVDHNPSLDANVKGLHQPRPL